MNTITTDDVQSIYTDAVYCARWKNEVIKTLKLQSDKLNSWLELVSIYYLELFNFGTEYTAIYDELISKSSKLFGMTYANIRKIFIDADNQITARPIHNISDLSKIKVERAGNGDLSFQIGELSLLIFSTNYNHLRTQYPERSLDIILAMLKYSMIEDCMKYPMLDVFNRGQGLPELKGIFSPITYIDGNFFSVFREDINLGSYGIAFEYLRSLDLVAHVVIIIPNSVRYAKACFEYCREYANRIIDSRYLLLVRIPVDGFIAGKLDGREIYYSTNNSNLADWFTPI